MPQLTPTTSLLSLHSHRKPFITFVWLVACCKSSTLTKIYCNFLVSPILRIAQQTSGAWAPLVLYDDDQYSYLFGWN